MTSVEEIRSKLRSKGIVLDGGKLAHGLVNIKEYALEERPSGFPCSVLPSNPLYKKFPL
jgi:hypothetical protein